MSVVKYVIKIIITGILALMLSIVSWIIICIVNILLLSVVEIKEVYYLTSFNPPASIEGYGCHTVEYDTCITDSTCSYPVRVEYHPSGLGKTEVRVIAEIDYNHIYVTNPKLYIKGKNEELGFNNLDELNHIAREKVLPAIGISPYIRSISAVIMNIYFILLFDYSVIILLVLFCISCKYVWIILSEKFRLLIILAIFLILLICTPIIFASMFN